MAKPETPCIEWLGTKTGEGYGWIAGHGLAHRFAYIEKNGPIPSDREIDHLCRNRLCMSPDHLEAVPHRENILRGESPSAKNARKTHCPRGHALEGDNLFIDGRKRACRQCRTDASHRWWVKRRGSQPPRARLTPDDVREIRQLAESVPQIEIARRFGLSHQHVSEVVNRKRWAHV